MRKKAGTDEAIPAVMPNNIADIWQVKR